MSENSVALDNLVSPENRVIVVGAGPTGMLLAGDLAEAGIPVTLLERRSGETSNLSRALAVHATTLEAFDARGIADALVEKGAPVLAPILAARSAQLAQFVPTWAVARRSP